MNTSSWILTIIYCDCIPLRFQQAFITARLEQNSGQHWMGFSNRGDPDGQWSWVSGFVSSTDYTHWDSAFTGQCVQNCGKNTRYLCQYTTDLEVPRRIELCTAHCFLLMHHCSTYPVFSMIVIMVVLIFIVFVAIIQKIATTVVSRFALTISIAVLQAMSVRDVQVSVQARTAWVCGVYGHVRWNWTSFAR